MPDLITAPITRNIVSYGLERCLDTSRTKFPTDLELFDYINVVVRDLARFSLLLKSDVFIKLIPNQVEYNYVSITDKLINILQIETVTIISNTDVEGVSLEFRNKKEFRQNVLTDTGISTQKYYTFDGVNIAYWRPVTTTTDRLKLRVARDLLESENVSQIQDPPEEIVAKFLPYIQYGLVKEMALARPDDKDIFPLAQVYNRLYQDYKQVDLIPKTLDTHHNYIGTSIGEKF